MASGALQALVAALAGGVGGYNEYSQIEQARREREQERLLRNQDRERAFGLQERQLAAGEEDRKFGRAKDIYSVAPEGTEFAPDVADVLKRANLPVANAVKPVSGVATPSMTLPGGIQSGPGQTLGNVRDVATKPESLETRQLRQSAQLSIPLFEQLSKDPRWANDPTAQAIFTSQIARGKSGLQPTVTETDVTSMARSLGPEAEARTVGLPSYDEANDILAATGVDIRKPGAALTPEQIAKVRSFQKANRGAVPQPDRGPSDYQVANLEGSIGRQVDGITTASRTAIQQANVARAGYSEYKAAVKGGRPQGPATQAIIMSFGKVLDPGSVVRESEYNRSAEMQSLFNRFDALKNRVLNGGVLAENEVDELMRTVDAVSNSYKQQQLGHLQRAKSRVTSGGGRLENVLTPEQIGFIDASEAEGMLQGKPPGTGVTVNGVNYVKLPNGNVVKAMK